MASQIDKVRLYTDPTEATDTHLTKCPLCKVKAVPRGLTSTRTHHNAGGEKHCPNCGHVYGRKNH